MNRRCVAAGSVVAAFGLLVGCSSPAGAPRTNPKPPVPTFSTSARPTSVPVGTTPPKSCDSVGAAADIDKIVGHALAGAANQVVGVAMTSIARTARLDCYYGVPDGQPRSAAVLTIAVSTYADPQSAQARVTSTADDARAAGATVSTVKVDSAPATLMVSQQSQALALAVGTRTVAVTTNTGVLPQGNDTPQLTALARLGLAAHA
ncbi:MAG TPA: hypothetical protein VGD84_23610 [Pseudonocardiaceae bacterium]